MPSSNSEARKRHEERCAADLGDLMDDAPKLRATWEQLNHPQRLIGLSGWAQSGKDSMGHVLEAYTFQTVARFIGMRKSPLRQYRVVTSPTRSRSGSETEN